MATSTWICVFFLLFLVLQQKKMEKQSAVRRLLATRQTEKEKQKMVELAKQFIGKECIIYTLNNQINGTIQAVSDGGLVLENNGTREIVNLDYILRIREYPRHKNGKKKSVVIDRTNEKSPEAATVSRDFFISF